MFKEPDALARISLAIRHEQIGQSALHLRGIDKNIERAVQQLRCLRKLVVQAEHSRHGGGATRDERHSS